MSPASRSKSFDDDLVVVLSAYYAPGTSLGTLQVTSSMRWFSFYNLGIREGAAVDKCVGIGVRLPRLKSWPCYLLCDLGQVT